MIEVFNAVFSYTLAVFGILFTLWLVLDYARESGD
jgi:hypothetical protein